MNLHEKSLELNITHELLNLADSFNWHLSNITLWRYWNPSYDHFRRNDYKKSTAYGLHSSIEGLDDNTGDAGGGYDAKIKSGKNDSVLFIQYKRGIYSTTEPPINNDGNRSTFRENNVNHFKFKLNSTVTNQHFTLRNLSENITSQNGNAVVYAFPLIKDIEDLDNNAGKIIRRTKFISIKEIDDESVRVGRPFQLDDHHSYRICAENMARSELNYYYYYYYGFDSSIGVICDTIILGIQKTLQNSLNNLTKKGLLEKYQEILELTINSYKRYIYDYFEVPTYFENDKYIIETNKSIFPDTLTSIRDLEIVKTIMEYLDSLIEWTKEIESQPLPEYKTKNFTYNVALDIDFKSKALHNTNMIKI